MKADESLSRRELLRVMTIAAGFSSVGVKLYATPNPTEGIFELGDFQLQSGTTLRIAKIAYKTHGELNSDKTNVILYPTQFGAQHGDIEWMIGSRKALDTDKYFIIVLDQLGNGLSSSPSNTPPPQDRMRFPTITILDDVAAQHRLIVEQFGISKVALVTGYSMGAQQAYQWAVSHPEIVERIAPFCGTAKTTPHNIVFLEGVRAALTADQAWQNGEYKDQPVNGMRALSRVYAGWGLSQQFYKQELYKQLGFDSLEAFITGFWEKRYMKRDANNLLSMLRTWRLNDVGKTPGFNDDYGRALRSIKAKCTIMAGQTDLYFTAADIKEEAARIRGARFVEIPSLWGHMAGAGLNPADSDFIQQEIKTLLAS